MLIVSLFPLNRTKTHKFRWLIFINCVIVQIFRAKYSQTRQLATVVKFATHRHINAFSFSVALIKIILIAPVIDLK